MALLTRPLTLAAVAALTLSLAACGDRTAPDPVQALRQAEAGLPAASRASYLEARLLGYFLLAQRQSFPGPGQPLAEQGMLEVYDAEPGVFPSGTAGEATLRRAAQTGRPEDLHAAVDAVSKARTEAGGDDIAVTRALVRLASGLYRQVANNGGIDALEYQHSLAAVLAARAVMQGATDRKLTRAGPVLEGLLALFPTPGVPPEPASLARIQAQADQVLAALN